MADPDTSHHPIAPRWHADKLRQLADHKDTSAGMSRLAGGAANALYALAAENAALKSHNTELSAALIKLSAEAAALRAEVERLKRTVSAAAALGEILGFLGGDEGREAAFWEVCGEELIARARAALTAPSRPDTPR